MIYEVDLMTITPLHIGSGEILLRDYDFVSGRDQTWVLDQDAVYADVYERTGQVPAAGRPPGRLIAARELKDDSPFVRYGLAGTTTVDQVREQIKDVQGRCYLPGSSLKGALRTVLLAQAVRSKTLDPDVKALGRNKSWAAQAWERSVFGRDPNHDLLRALRVADSAPLAKTPSRLRLLEARVFTGNQPSAPVWVEAVAHQTTFQTTIEIDEWLLHEQAESLGWSRNADWLTRLPELANAWAKERIAAESQFAAQAGWANPGRAFEVIGSYKPNGSRFPLQVGWGTGWGGITMGTLLSVPVPLQVRDQYQLGRPPRGRGDWKPNPAKPFPASRRYAVAYGRNASAVPGVPLGWMLVTLKPRG